MSEFKLQPLVHHLLFYLVPVLSDRNLPGLAHFECLNGLWSYSDFHLIGLSFELFRLEIVFIRGIFDTLFFHWWLIKIRHVAKGLVFPVKLDRSFMRLFFHFQIIKELIIINPKIDLAIKSNLFCHFLIICRMVNDCNY